MINDDYYIDTLFGRCKRSTIQAIGAVLVLLNVLALIALFVISVTIGAR